MIDVPALQHADQPFDVAVVGGGFSGTMVAVHLSRIPGFDARVVMFDRANAFGKGAAYSPPADHCLLNVPAKAMGAFPDDEGGFVAWLERTGRIPVTASAGDGFVPRRLYGEYLSELLDAAGANGTRIERRPAAITDLLAGHDGYILTDENGCRTMARAVVLAIGNLPPGGFTDGVLSSALARHALDPWCLLNGGRIAADDDVVIVGTGLTALDVLLYLAEAGHQGRITMLSRHGRFPLPHANPGEPPLGTAPLVSGSPAQVLRAVRRLAAEAVARGSTWQVAIDAVRPQVTRIWQLWSPSERRQFLRHVASLWQVHRHRAPAPALRARDRLLESGRLHIVRGRLRSIVAAGAALRVTYTERPSARTSTLRADAIVNCTGPRRNFKNANEPLLDKVIARGLAATDALELGFVADREGRLAGCGRAPLYALGTPLRGMLYECNAVRELRVQAADIAAAIARAQTQTLVAS